MNEALQSILIVLIIFGATFGIIYVIVTARNKERMAMIEKGINPKDFITQKKVSVIGILKWALLLTGIGLGLFFGSLLETYTALSDEAAYFACALLFGGLGLVVAFLITRKVEKDK